MKQYNLGLCLGSGGARGLAHIGVLRAMKEAGIKPDIVAGTSIGSIVGAAVALGLTDKLEEVADKIDLAKTAGIFFELGIQHGGLIKGTKVMEFLGNILPDCLIEEMPMPFAAIATDLNTGEVVVIDHGKLLSAIRASISIPGVFTPVRRGRRLLVDGGISSPVPISTLRKMGAKKIIAVNIDNNKTCPYFNRRLPPVVNKTLGITEKIKKGIEEKFVAKKHPLENLFSGMGTGIGFFDVLLKSSRIFEDRIALSEIKTTQPDILIDPPVGDIGTLDFTRVDDAIRVGYEEAKAVLTQERPKIGN